MCTIQPTFPSVIDKENMAVDKITSVAAGKSPSHLSQSSLEDEVQYNIVSFLL